MIFEGEKQRRMARGRTPPEALGDDLWRSTLNLGVTCVPRCQDPGR
jgi:hypothetical protein